MRGGGGGGWNRKQCTPCNNCNVPVHSRWTMQRLTDTAQTLCQSRATRTKGNAFSSAYALTSPLYLHSHTNTKTTACRPRQTPEQAPPDCGVGCVRQTTTRRGRVGARTAGRGGWGGRRKGTRGCQNRSGKLARATSSVAYALRLTWLLR